MTPEQEAARLFAGGAPIELADGRTIVRDPENPGRAFVIPRAPTLLESIAKLEPFMPLPAFSFFGVGGCSRVLDSMARRAHDFEVEHGGLLRALLENTGARRPANMLPREHICVPWCEADAVLELRIMYREALFARDLALADAVLVGARRLGVGEQVEAWHDDLLDEATAPR